jgi:hypothetical protein
MSVIINGDTGITTPAETVQGALTTTGNTILGDAATDTLNVGAGGLVKDASGNVGIGTASPSAKISLKNPSVTNEQFIVDVLGATNSTRLLYASVNQTTDVVNFGTGYGAPIAFVTNSIEQARIDSAGLFKFNSGYGSAATAYGCRAWVNFNGTGTVAIRASGNVSSITDGGVGQYTVNLTTAIVDTNYSVVAGNGNNAVANTSSNITNITSSSAVAFTHYEANGSQDVAQLFLAIFR